MRKQTDSGVCWGEGEGEMTCSAEDLLRTELVEIRRREEAVTHVLGMIYRFTELLPKKLGVHQTCEHLVKILIEETDFENCSIALWDEAQGCLALVAAFGLADLLGEVDEGGYHRHLKFFSNREVASRVFASHRPAFIEDAEKDPIPEKASAVVHAMSLICLPLLDLGILNISAPTPRRISAQQKRDWILLGNIIAQLILTASLYDRLGSINRNLQEEVNEKTKKLEERNRELAAANAFLEQIVDRAPEGIGLLDCRGEIRRVNGSMQTLQGVRDEEMFGRTPAVFFHDSELYRSLLREVEAAGHGRLSDVLLVDSRGEPYPADVYLTRLTDDSGNVGGYVFAAYDMSEKKALAEQFIRTEKLAAVGTMAGGVAHDFNNLLMAVLGNTQLLLLQITDEGARRRLESIEMAVKDAAHTLRRLQTFTCPSRGEGQGCSSATNAGEVLQDVVELTRPRWKNALEKFGHAIDLAVDLQPDCYAVIHASDLREILTNLVLNAVDAMPTGGTLSLACGEREDSIFIDVADTGLGMTEEVQRKIFDPFFTTKGFGNSGLGLSVSWSLVNRCGGDMRVRSQLGRGSIFQIRLPRHTSPLGASVDRGIPSDRATRRLLLVDDDKEVLRLLRDMIRLSGHKVVATHDGREALQLLESEEIDLVMTDLGMPVVTGWEVARRVKERNAQTPVILLTGWGVQYEKNDLAAHGVDMVLSKPLSYDKLQEVLQNFC